MTFSCDDKQAQFSSYTAENASGTSLNKGKTDCIIIIIICFVIMLDLETRVFVHGEMIKWQNASPVPVFEESTVGLPLLTRHSMNREQSLLLWW